MKITIFECDERHVWEVPGVHTAGMCPQCGAAEVIAAEIKHGGIRYRLVDALTERPSLAAKLCGLSWATNPSAAVQRLLQVCHLPSLGR